MKFSKKEEPDIRADKLSGTGAVYYSTWLDEKGEQFFRIEKVVGGSGVSHGRFDSDVYRLLDIGRHKKIKGYDLVSGLSRITSNNNMSGYLRAVEKDVVRRREEAARKKRKILK